ncbi:DUF5908 family protein [Halioxenophilus sp. WMMB6]|uniref:DUF5908 family protein n=1 Tax=Halioxenophilus sp. WMMB6 TaxID=3073815 RepID=UPI00295ECF2D|nr:DUF5908 family protein [Halioxenophilus sp. WMMB6]
MPVIIDEVVISIDVNNQAAGGATKKPSELEEQQALIEECVERVLDILEQRKEP